MAEPLRTVSQSPSQAGSDNARRQVPRDVAPRPSQPPVGGIRPRLVAVAASMVIVFLLAISFFMTSSLATDLNLFGVMGFAVIFFTLTLGLAGRAAHDPRWSGQADRRRQADGRLADDEVTIATGTISGRSAMVQLLVLPVTLAAGMVILGLIFAMGL